MPANEEITILDPLKLADVFDDWANGLHTADAPEADFFEDCYQAIHDEADHAKDRSTYEEAVEDVCRKQLSDCKDWLHPGDYGAVLREAMEAGAIRVSGIAPPRYPRELPEPWKWGYPIGSEDDYSAIVTPASLKVCCMGFGYLYYWTVTDHSGKFGEQTGTARSADDAARAAAQAAETWFTDPVRIEKLRGLAPGAAPGRIDVTSIELTE